MKVTIYTDGACDIHAENQPGGWAAILHAVNENGDVLKETVLSGGAEFTTNNKMELTAVIEGLRKLYVPTNVTIVTDSKYVIDIATGKHRIHTNRDLWREYFVEEKWHKVEWEYIKGHAGHEYNERCDKIAVSERKKLLRGSQHFDFDDVDVFLASSHSKQKNHSAWSTYILRGGQTEIRGAVIERVTGYEALLIGCIKTIRSMPELESVTICCSNTGFLRGVNERLQKWLESNWKTIDANTGEQRPISKYVNYWKEIAHLKEQRTVRFIKADHFISEKYIDRARKLARWLLKNSL